MEEEVAAIDEVPEQGTAPLGEPAAPGSGLRWRRVFPGEGSQLGVLRRWLASLLPDCPSLGDVASVATELGSNALVHTASGRGGQFAVEITCHQAVVRVAVADCGAPGGPRVIDDPAGEYGRGLLLVRGLSVRTGVRGDHRGRLVWADVPCGDVGAAEPMSPPSEQQLITLCGKLRSRGADAIVPGLGPLESAVMTAVWDVGQPLTVRGVRDRMDYRASNGDSPAYTTVMTVMSILWRKGLLKRGRDLRDGNPRAWWYEARITREDHLGAVIRDALDCAPDPAAVLRRALGRG